MEKLLTYAFTDQVKIHVLPLHLRIKSEWKKNSPLRLQSKSKFMFHLCVYRSSQNGKKLLTSAFTDQVKIHVSPLRSQISQMEKLLTSTSSSCRQPPPPTATCTQRPAEQFVQSIQKWHNLYRVYKKRAIRTE